MEGNPRVSVMIPVFNREQYLKEAIQSILNQTYQNWELLIYNDGSTDQTEQVIQQFAQQDERITPVYRVDGQKKRISVVNQGVGFARNILLHACETEIACYQDSDDWSHPMRLEIQVKNFEPGKLLFTNWQWMISQPTDEDWLKLAFMPRHDRAYASVMFRPDKNILYDETKILGAEDCIWIDQMKAAGRAEQILPNLLYVVRNHDDRIGHWKRKIFSKFSRPEILGLTYAQAIEKYKNSEGIQ